MSMALFEDWLLGGEHTNPTRDQIIRELTELALHGIDRRDRRRTAPSTAERW
jgi:hypothetical protein